MPLPKYNQTPSPSSPASGTSAHYIESTFENRKIYTCSLTDCGKTFKFKSEMNRHLAVHSDTRPYPCLFPNCGKTFKRADALSNHARIHNQSTSFHCTEKGCGQQFVTKSALRYHLLKHNGDKEFVCTQNGCNKSFTTQNQLRQHEKSSAYHRKINGSSPNGDDGSYYSPESTHNGEGNVAEIDDVGNYGSLNDLEKPEIPGYNEIAIGYGNYGARKEVHKEDVYDNFNYLEHIYGSTGAKQVHYNEQMAGQITQMTPQTMMRNPNLPMNASANLDLINANYHLRENLQQRPMVAYPAKPNMYQIGNMNSNIDFYANNPVQVPRQNKKEDFDNYIPNEDYSSLFA